MLRIDRNKPAILEFQGDHRWLSNFWEVPFVHNDIYFKSSEHYYQANKSISLEDIKRIAICDKPKAEGRRLTIREDWDSIKVAIMRNGLEKKFKDPVLRQKLVDTEDCMIVEGNYWHDNFWGNCTCDKCIYLEGQNMLGILLMELREDMKHEHAIKY